jgi:prophage regulatory protein
MTSSSNNRGRALTAETLQTFKSLNSILRLPQVLAASGGISQSSLYAYAASGLYPKPIKIGKRASGIPAAEVAAMNAARIAGKSDDDIRALVRKLMADRATLAA